MRNKTVTTVALSLTLLMGSAGAALPAAAATPDEPVTIALDTPGRLDSVTDVRALAADTAGDPGVRVGVVIDTNGSAPGGISVEHIATPSAEVGALTDRIDGLAGVVSATVDVPVQLLADPQSSQQYAPARIQSNTLSAGLDGLGTTVAVIDSGVLATQPDLATPLRNGTPRVLAGTSFLWGSAENRTPGNVDPHGHGTHVAGIVSAARDNGIGGSGVAPGARILPVRVLAASGSGYSSDVAAGILWAHQQGADVINMSLGAPGGEFPADVDRAIQTATTDTSRGKPPTVVVAAAGNNGAMGDPSWPGRHPRAIAVAATDSLDRIATFSTRGNYVSVAAPGAGIYSTCITGKQCSMSGTSMASPMVAAASAILRQQDPTRTPDTIRALLEQSATDLGAPGKDVEYGAGRINLAAATATTVTTPVPTPPAPKPAARVPVMLTGNVDTAVLDRRRFTFGGQVQDPDAAPVVIVRDAVAGRLATTRVAGANGRWQSVTDLEPGSHVICATGLDQPTGTETMLGCQQLVVK